jgi:hypothetical protein
MTHVETEPDGEVWWPDELPEMSREPMAIPHVGGNNETGQIRVGSASATHIDNRDDRTAGFDNSAADGAMTATRGDIEIATGGNEYVATLATDPEPLADQQDNSVAIALPPDDARLTIDHVTASKNTVAIRLRWSEKRDDGSSHRKAIYLQRLHLPVFEAIYGGDYDGFKKAIIEQWQTSGK